MEAKNLGPIIHDSNALLEYSLKLAYLDHDDSIWQTIFNDSDMESLAQFGVMNTANQTLPFHISMTKQPVWSTAMNFIEYSLDFIAFYKKEAKHLRVLFQVGGCDFAISLYAHWSFLKHVTARAHNRVVLQTTQTA